MRNKVIIQFTILLSAIYLIFYSLDWLLTYGLSTSKINNTGVWNSVRESKVNADILIVGASKSLVGIDCLRIEEKTKKSCFNISMDGNHLQQQVPTLNYYLKHNKKPKLIIQNISSNSFEKVSQLYWPVIYKPLFQDKMLYDDLKKIDLDIWKYKYLPLYSYSLFGPTIIKVALKSLLKLENIKTNKFTLGSQLKDIPWDNSFENFIKANSEGINFKISEEGKNAFDKLLQIENNLNVKMFVLMMPEWSGARKYGKNWNEVLNVIKIQTVKNNIKFYNYLDINWANNKAYFYNSSHLNKKGAQLFTSYILSELSEFLL